MAAAGESFFGGQTSITMPFPRPQPTFLPVSRDVQIVKV